MIEGKILFSWNVPTTLKGDPNATAKAVFDAGFEGIALKGGEGNTIFTQRRLGPYPTWGENIKEELVIALRALGLKVYIWHFLYGVDPLGELKVAQRLCDRFNPDGYIWDAEARFDEKSAAEANARLLTKGLRISHTNIHQALCWWALPKNPENLNVQWHPVRVGKAFLETVDVLMPMMYWGGKTSFDALLYLQRSLNVWETIGNFPMIPIGRAYTGDGGTIDPVAILAFANRLMELRENKNIVGIGWWVLDSAFKNSDAWQALKLTRGFDKLVIDMSRLSVEEILKRLVLEHPELFPELFVRQEN